MWLSSNSLLHGVDVTSAQLMWLKPFASNINGAHQPPCDSSRSFKEFRFQNLSRILLKSKRRSTWITWLSKGTCDRGPRHWRRADYGTNRLKTAMVEFEEPKIVLLLTEVSKLLLKGGLNWSSLTQPDRWVADISFAWLLGLDHHRTFETHWARGNERCRRPTMVLDHPKCIQVSHTGFAKGQAWWQKYEIHMEPCRTWK